MNTFTGVGFECEFRCTNSEKWWTRLLPPSWRRNGFPDGNTILEARKPVKNGLDDDIYLVSMGGGT